MSIKQRWKEIMYAEAISIERSERRFILEVFTPCHCMKAKKIQCL